MTLFVKKSRESQNSAQRTYCRLSRCQNVLFVRKKNCLLVPTKTTLTTDNTVTTVTTVTTITNGTTVTTVTTVTTMATITYVGRKVGFSYHLYSKDNFFTKVTDGRTDRYTDGQLDY